MDYKLPTRDEIKTMSSSELVQVIMDLHLELVRFKKTLQILEEQLESK